MPITDKGFKILKNMKAEYGSEKGERVFYASANKGTIKGVHGKSEKPHHSSPTSRPHKASAGAHEAGAKDKDPREFEKHEAKESPETEAMEKKVNARKGFTGLKNVYRAAK